MDEDWYELEQLHFAAPDGIESRVRELIGAPDALAAMGRFDVIGCTPLHYAVEREHYAIAKSLIERGSDVNAHDVDNAGETPLGRVAASCSPVMARFLMERGADPAVRGWMGLTALYRTEQRKDEDGLAVVKILKTVRKGL